MWFNTVCDCHVIIIIQQGVESVNSRSAELCAEITKSTDCQHILVLMHGSYPVSYQRGGSYTHQAMVASRLSWFMLACSIPAFYGLAGYQHPSCSWRYRSSCKPQFDIWGKLMYVARAEWTRSETPREDTSHCHDLLSVLASYHHCHTLCLLPVVSILIIQPKPCRRC